MRVDEILAGEQAVDAVGAIRVSQRTDGPAGRIQSHHRSQTHAVSGHRDLSRHAAEPRRVFEFG